MRPRKLYLENIGPFVGKALLDFDELDDIFLISGKTGAGKTTIFDAICYALYGVLPGGRKGYHTRLRSDFAPENEESSVSLEFSLDQKTYRVDRSPKQEKIKKRGTGTTEIEETASLYEMTASGLLALSGKKTEADQRITELLGLSSLEFTKIVLLPQGEFAEFLRQNTTERREVLRKIFPVDLAVQVREKAVVEAKDAQSRLEEAERVLAERGTTYNPELYQEQKKRVQGDLERAKKEALACEKEASRLARVLQNSEAFMFIASRFEEATKKARELEEDGLLVKKKEESLARSRAAKPLSLLAERENEEREKLKNAAQSLERAKKQKEESSAALQRLELDSQAEHKKTEELAQLNSLRSSLIEELKNEEDLNKEKAIFAELEAQKQAKERTKQVLAQKLKEKNEELQLLSEKAEKAEDLDAAWERQKEAMEGTRLLKALAEDFEKLEAERTSSKEKARILEEQSLELEKRIPILEAEIEEKETEQRQNERREAAAKLALDLAPLMPCPVCGSTEHPLPAAAPKLSFGMSERIDALKKSKSDAELQLASFKANLFNARRELERLDAEINRLYIRSNEIQKPEKGGENKIPSAASMAVRLQERIETLNKTVGLRDEARRSRSRLPLFFKENEEARKGLDDVAIALSEVSGALARLGSSIEQKLERRAQALSKVPHSPSLEAALSEMDRGIESLEKALRSQRQRRETALEEAATAKARLESAFEAELASQKAHADSHTAFLEALGNSPFRDAGELSMALLAEEEEKKCEQGIAAWKEARSETASLLKELQRSLDEAQKTGASKTDIGELKEAELRNLEKREEAEKLRDSAAASLATLENEKRAYVEAAERQQMLAIESNKLRRLANDLSGINPKKRAFDSWLLSLYLAEVAAFASKRLQKMSEGRFSLFLDSEGEGGRGRSGLDLAVFDAYTGRERPCATLSGGESFMASISLALGLADSIQSRAGGLRLDAVFIDEGFGSLDETSLDKALGILDEIRDHRMVGLISHVGEMRNRIPSRVDIIKADTGSRIQISHGT
ncbi:AAA family ATPase [Treponema sp.]